MDVVYFLLDPQAHVNLSDAVGALADFVELTGAGVLTTMEARGVYDERNPRWQGVFVARGSVRPVIPEWPYLTHPGEGWHIRWPENSPKTEPGAQAAQDWHRGTLPRGNDAGHRKPRAKGVHSGRASGPALCAYGGVATNESAWKGGMGDR